MKLHTYFNIASLNFSRVTIFTGSDKNDPDFRVDARRHNVSMSVHTNTVGFHKGIILADKVPDEDRTSLEINA